MKEQQVPYWSHLQQSVFNFLYGLVIIGSCVFTVFGMILALRYYPETFGDLMRRETLLSVATSAALLFMTSYYVLLYTILIVFYTFNRLGNTFIPFYALDYYPRAMHVGISIKKPRRVIATKRSLESIRKENIIKFSSGTFVIALILALLVFVVGPPGFMHKLVLSTIIFFAVIAGMFMLVFLRNCLVYLGFSQLTGLFGSLGPWVNPQPYQGVFDDDSDSNNEPQKSLVLVSLHSMLFTLGLIILLAAITMMAFIILLVFHIR